MIRLAMPPGAYITISRKTRPRYSSHALVNSDSSTSETTISTAPMMGPKKKVAPPRKVNSRYAPERAAPTTSAVAISKFSAYMPPAIPAKKPAMMNAM